MSNNIGTSGEEGYSLSARLTAELDKELREARRKELLNIRAYIDSQIKNLDPKVVSTDAPRRGRPRKEVVPLV